MPQKKKRQEFFGVHRALAFHRDIRKFAARRPGAIRGIKELSIVYDAAMRPLFFSNLPSQSDRITSFGRIYQREPDVILELMQLIRKILSEWQKSESGIVKIFLLTHRTVFVDDRKPIYDEKGNCVTVIVKSTLDGTEKHIPASNLPPNEIDKLMRSKLVAVGSLLDKEIATFLRVKPETVKKARQFIARQDKQIAFWENPEVVRYMETGKTTSKLKRIWRTHFKGKN